MHQSGQGGALPHNEEPYAKDTKNRHDGIHYVSRAAQEKERYALTDRMAKLITKRGSHIRGKVVDGLRALFASHYSFQRTGSKGAIAANKLKAQALLDGASSTIGILRRGPASPKNAILAAARHHTIFKNKHSLAAVFRSYFDPIPAPYLALDFAVPVSMQRLGSASGLGTASECFERLAERLGTSLKPFEGLM
ncbi:hypothetical protein B0H11DRAFT_1931152 [Mycena galericulata]|nr:hypothetical protein B0H11DRAFT_1931152 [Mycena galericulata]